MSNKNEFKQLLLESVAANLQLEEVAKTMTADEIQKLKDELAKCKEQNKAG